ncbi:solute carrier organic anion transporter family member 3A1-like [Glandiceps talaboti]
MKQENGKALGINKCYVSESSFTKMEEDDPDDIRCGYFCCQPRCLQQFGGPKPFVIFLSLSLLLSTCVSGGYLSGTISTVERRYQLPSSMSGTLLMFNEIGSMATILFVTYFGSKGHRPRIIGIGFVLVGLGSIITSLPQFMSSPLIPPSSHLNHSGKASTEVCLPGENATNSRDEQCDDGDSQGGLSNHTLLFFMIGQLIVGVGSTPFFTLGTTYIDDGVKKHATSVYLAFMFTCSMLGPMLGFILSSVTLKRYVDFYRIDQSLIATLSPGDPRWVGAWWAGFLLVGAVLTFTAVPMFGFPRWVKIYHYLLFYQYIETCFLVSRLPKALWRLLSNVTLMSLCFGTCFDMSFVAGFAVFTPKYMERQFGLPAGYASMLMGIIVVPSMVVGIFLGGVIVKKLKLSRKGCTRMVLIVACIRTAITLILFALWCENPNIAGVFVPYSSQDSQNLQTVDSTSYCNANCECSVDDFAPVCGNDGITYLSPCHAGCKDVSMTAVIEKIGRPLQNFSDCSCIPIPYKHTLANESSTSGGFAISLPCPSSCPYMWVTLAVIAIGQVVGAMGQNPGVLLVIRTVTDEDRSLSMALNIVMLRLFAFIPAPVIFGAAIDSTCVLWNKSCDRTGACLVYDMIKYKYVYVGLAIAYMTLALLCYAIALKSVKDDNKPLQVKESEEKVGTRLGTVLAYSRESLSTEEHTMHSFVPDSRTPDYELEHEKSTKEYFL